MKKGRRSDSIEWLSDTFDEKMREILGEKATCSCGRLLDRGDLEWNDGSTEYGTPFSVARVECQACGQEIIYGHSWYPEVDDEDALLEVLSDVVNPY